MSDISQENQWSRSQSEEEAVCWDSRSVFQRSWESDFGDLSTVLVCMYVTCRYIRYVHATVVRTVRTRRQTHRSQFLGLDFDFTHHDQGST